MVFDIGGMGTMFWRSPFSCMLARLECSSMNGVTSISTRVGGHMVLLCAMFWSSKTIPMAPLTSPSF